jgi:hypothetical protein
MIRLLVILFSLSISLNSFAGPEDYIKEKPPEKSSKISAEGFGVEVGMRTQSGEVNNSRLSTSSKNGFQVGGVGQFQFSGQWGARSGLFYTQRPLSVSAKDPFTGSGEVLFTYFDIPAQLMLSFEDYAGVFIGPVISLLLEKKWTVDGNFSTNEITGAKSIVLPIQLGATFKFAPQIGATIYYEGINDSLADNISNYRAAGINLLFTFD